MDTHHVIQLSENIAQSLQRALQVQLSKRILPLLQQSVQNNFSLLAYLGTAWFAFDAVHFGFFHDFILTIVVKLILDMLEPLQNSQSFFVALFHTSFLFITMQSVVRRFPVELATRISGNILYMYAYKLNTIMHMFIQSDLAGAMILFALVLLMQRIQIDNEQFSTLYSMAATQAIQNIVLNSIPPSFIIPSTIVVTYALQILQNVLNVGQTFYDFLTYNAAILIKTKLETVFTPYILIFLSIGVLFFAHAIHYHQPQQIFQTLTILAAVECVVNYLAPIYSADSILAIAVLIIVLQAVRQITEKI